MTEILSWLQEHRVEVSGTISGLAYLYFSIRQSIWTWPLGLLSSALYVYVFFVSKFYADMGLQFYYVIISIYGWYAWLHGNGNSNNQGELKVSRTSFVLWVKLFIVNLLLYVGIAYILIDFTDSPVPYWDSFTTALSIVATWMLARKKIEHWLLWVVIDAVSLGLYIYKGLYATTVLFFVYTVMAVVGFIEWRKDLANNR
ncbi:nicotinamide riboside transporter PnuC [Prolixibacter sp. NT017]|uniref:nicotinamide riboside transporter PnuC n=1 Tax=Prolixibacter sp. NT017 TaxID=2652390 RepID=UPI00127B37B5|nr:nicotinamide riboside transporter PnuC [Prolixibacter sp. NT017]GET23816.1 membrane protein [Prolixibacter sp. NT017]